MFSYIFNLLNPFNRTEEKSGIFISLLFAIFYFMPSLFCSGVIVYMCGSIASSISGYDLLSNPKFDQFAMSCSFIVVYIVCYLISPTVCTILLLLAFLYISCGYVVKHVEMNIVKFVCIAVLLYIVYVVSINVNHNSRWCFNKVIELFSFKNILSHDKIILFFNILYSVNHSENKNGIVISLFYAILYSIPFIYGSSIVNIIPSIIDLISGYEILQARFKWFYILCGFIVVSLIWYIITPTVSTILLLSPLYIGCGYVIKNIEFNFVTFVFISELLYVVTMYITQNSRWYCNKDILTKLISILNPFNHTEEMSGIFISLFYAILYSIPTFICIYLIFNFCGGIVGEINVNLINYI